jgi:hypothetical protein
VTSAFSFVGRSRTVRHLVFGLVAAAVACCVDPAAEQARRQREDARLAVAADAAFYWQCAHKAVVQAGECRQWSEAYERDRAAFVAKYGDAKR